MLMDADISICKKCTVDEEMHYSGEDILLLIMTTIAISPYFVTVWNGGETENFS